MVREPKSCGAFPRLQHRELALHDSKVLGWSLDLATLTVRLDAYIFVSQGRPGVDPGTAWSQPIELVLGDARLLEQPSEPPLWISEGVLSFDGASMDGLPLPCERRGDISLSLAGSSGRLIATGKSLLALERGEPRFIERVQFDL